MDIRIRDDLQEENVIILPRVVRGQTCEYVSAVEDYKLGNNFGLLVRRYPLSQIRFR